jgi:hypothetical protein
VLLGKEHELHLMDYMTDFHFDMRNSLIELRKVESIMLEGFHVRKYRNCNPHFLV